jgi:hypothetical protein
LPALIVLGRFAAVETCGDLRRTPRADALRTRSGRRVIGTRRRSAGAPCSRSPGAARGSAAAGASNRARAPASAGAAARACASAGAARSVRARAAASTRASAGAARSARARAPASTRASARASRARGPAGCARVHNVGSTGTAGASSEDSSRAAERRATAAHFTGGSAGADRAFAARVGAVDQATRWRHAPSCGRRALLDRRCASARDEDSGAPERTTKIRMHDSFEAIVARSTSFVRVLSLGLKVFNRPD